MANCKNYGVGPANRLGHIFADSEVLQVFLVSKKPRPGMAGSGICVLFLKFPPVLDIRIVDGNVRPHFGKFSNEHFRAAVARVPDIFPVGCTEYGYFTGRDDLPHVSQSIADQTGDMKRSRVVYVDRLGGYLEYVVFEPQKSL